MASLYADSAVVQSSSHTYTAHFKPQWCIGTVPHGGYVTSVFQRVASLHFTTTLSAQTQPDTMTMHLTFLRRTSAGPATFTVTDTKLGRGTSTIHITLSQSGHEEVVAYVTHTNLLTSSGLSFATSFTLVPPPPSVSLPALSQGNDSNWGRRHDLPFSDFRKATKHLQWHFPRSGQADGSLCDSWIRFQNPRERFTATTLGYVVDVFPQLTEMLRFWPSDPYSIAAETATEGSEVSKAAKTAAFWYPTVLLNLDVKKRLPDEGVEWLFTRVRAKMVKDGRYDLEVLVYDEGGDLVAVSNHVCLILSSARNIQQRSRKAKL